MVDAGRFHQVSCSLVSGPAGSASFAEAERLATRLNAYARRLGFGVMSENVDEVEDQDPLSSVLTHLDGGPE